MLKVRIRLAEGTMKFEQEQCYSEIICLIRCIVFQSSSWKGPLASILDARRKLSMFVNLGVAPLQPALGQVEPPQPQPNSFFGSADCTFYSKAMEVEEYWSILSMNLVSCYKPIKSSRL